jgi:GH15 family glucan-1,4-alpha-glucosidase
MSRPPEAATNDLVESSLRVLAAGQTASGAFLAGPTFSQYGYCWLRDGSFIAEALDLAGRPDSSLRFHHWVARIVLASAGGLERARATARAGGIPREEDYLHCRYDADGRATHDEGWQTFQLDGPGIWLWSLSRHLSHGGRLDETLAAAIAPAARYLADLWELPCADAWEEHGDRVHTSTLAAIRAGIEAAISMEPSLSVEPAVRRLRERIGDRMATVGGAYTKWDGCDEVDASLLWMAAPYGLVEPSESRFAATLQRIEHDLVDVDGGVHRFASDTFYGGGAWPVLTSAYGRVLLRRGRPGDRDRAAAALDWIEAQADAEGLLPEQVATLALAPSRIDEWRGRWGDIARPLLWSHAAYLALRTELMEAIGSAGSAPAVDGTGDRG